MCLLMLFQTVYTLMSKMINNVFTHFKSRYEAFHKLELPTGFVKMGHVLYLKPTFILRWMLINVFCRSQGLSRRNVGSPGDVPFLCSWYAEIQYSAWGRRTED